MTSKYRTPGERDDYSEKAQKDPIKWGLIGKFLLANGCTFFVTFAMAAWMWSMPGIVENGGYRWTAYNPPSWSVWGVFFSLVAAAIGAPLALLGAHK